MLTLLQVCEQNNLIKQRYQGIYEIYPTKFMNTMVLNKILLYFQNHNYELIKVSNNWIRAMLRS